MYLILVTDENDRIKISEELSERSVQDKKREKFKISVQMNTSIFFNHAFVSTNHSVYPTKPWEHTLKTRNKRCALIVQQMRSVFHCHRQTGHNGGFIIAIYLHALWPMRFPLHGSDSARVSFCLLASFMIDRSLMRKTRLQKLIDGRSRF